MLLGLRLRFRRWNEATADDKQAAAWFPKAAENGNVTAQAELGTRYWGGQRLPKRV